jgi:NADH-quinone oxidoreductase subunit G
VLDMRERGNLNEIFVAPGRQLEGHYTFMTEHVCPVGALTTKDFRFKARVWFLRTARSVCQGCATGCNAHLDYDPRYNRTYRYRPRDNEAVNKYWMCDEGMLSYRAAHVGRVVATTAKRKKTTVDAALTDVAKRFSGAPKEGFAFVLSAQHSLEDNWALRELARLSGATAIYVTGAGPGYKDDILIDEDKNPNTAGVVELVPTLRPFTQLIEDIKSGRVSHVVALGGVTPRNDPDDVTTLGMVSTVVVIAAHEGALTEAAHVVLPATSWAEQSGTFVNRQQIRQVAEKAIEPQGSSRPAWEQLRAIAVALGLEPTWTKLKDIRAELVAEPPTAAAATAPEAPTAPAAP